LENRIVSPYTFRVIGIKIQSESTTENSDKIGFSSQAVPIT